MLISNRFLVSVVDLWSRWKFLLTAAIILFALTNVVHPVATIFYIALLAAFFCFPLGLRDSKKILGWRDSKKILITPSQATFLRDHGTVAFCNRLSSTPPSTLADLWKVLTDLEEEQCEELKASTRREIVRIFNNPPGGERSEGGYEE